MGGWYLGCVDVASCSGPQYCSYYGVGTQCDTRAQVGRQIDCSGVLACVALQSEYEKDTSASQLADVFASLFVASDAAAEPSSSGVETVLRAIGSHAPDNRSEHAWFLEVTCFPNGFRCGGGLQ